MTVPLEKQCLLQRQLDTSLHKSRWCTLKERRSVVQGLTMDLRMGSNFNITSASLSAFDTIAIIILVPIYDRLLIPLLRRYNLAPTYLQRIGIGLGVSLISLYMLTISQSCSYKLFAMKDV